MNIGYAWVSTEDQNHDLQYAALKKVGCQHIFIEKATWTYVQRLSTGQKFQSPQEILKFFGEVEGEVAQEIEAVAEEGLERSPKCFFKGIGRCWS